MKIVIGLLLLLCAVLVFGQSITVTVAVATFGSAEAPVCVATTTVGKYQLPYVPSSLAVYRNGVRELVAGEASVSGSTLTLAHPIPEELVVCDIVR